MLCRIYNKSGNVPSSSAAQRQQEEYSNAEDAHFAPGSAAGVAPQSGGVKLPKSFSFCDLFDDGDYSVLARLLSENPLDMAGPSCPDLGPLLNLSQSSQIMNPGGDGGALGFSLPKLAQVESPASANGSYLKRQRSASDEENDANLKKPNNSFTDYTNFGSQLGASPPHCNMVNSPFLHPQMMLNSHLGLH